MAPDPRGRRFAAGWGVCGRCWPSRVTDLPTEPGWTFEPKWDGYRAIGALETGELRMTSRRGTNMAPWFPELAGLPDALEGHRVLVHGEVVALDGAGRPDFAALAAPRAPAPHPP
ncbi:MAG TPA: hypothetical protein VF933_28475 [Streptosporangiaceae bacterium]